MRMSPLCTRMSSVFHSMYSYVIRVLLACIYIPSICHCVYSYVTRMWFYHEPVRIVQWSTSWIEMYFVNQTMELRLDWANDRHFLVCNYQQFLEEKVVINHCVKARLNISHLVGRVYWCHIYVLLILIGALLMFYFYWMLDVSRAVSYEITLVGLPVRSSVHPALRFIKIKPLVFSYIVHDDSWP